MILINILLLQNLITQQQKVLLQDQHKQILASKSDIANYIKKTDLDDKIKNLNEKATSSKTKDVLVENKFKKTTNIFLKCFYLSKLL